MFPQAPLSSRTVGFPESGWQPRHFPGGPSRTSRGLSTRLHTPRERPLIPPARHPMGFTPLSRFKARTVSLTMPAMYREPLCPHGALPRTERRPTPPRPALPGLLRSDELIRRTQFLPRTLVLPCTRVLAGCCEPLLQPGTSRRYLRNPCVGAWTHTPQRPFGAFARFFPKGFGLTSDLTGSARQTIAAMQLQRRN